MEWNESEIAEALSRATEIADDVVPERQAPITPNPYRERVMALEAQREYSALGQALLAACRMAEPVSDEGHESYEDWRQRNPGHEGKGAGFLARLWRATRRKS